MKINTKILYTEYINKISGNFKRIRNKLKNEQRNKSDFQRAQIKYTDVT